MKFIFFYLLFFLSLFSEKLFAENKPIQNKWVRIPSGIYKPFYVADREPLEVQIEGFLIQEHPITNKEFLDFVKKDSNWQRDKIPLIFAENNYLIHWDANLVVGLEDLMEQPVTNVSWFVARAYCESIEARLPKHFEWEYVALASKNNANGKLDKDYNKEILNWYSRPTPKNIQKVMQADKNYYGLYDVHGLVWHWVEDFNSILVKTDARQSGQEKSGFFCGAGALSATEKEDYASFLRLGFLSSLKAKYVTKNLGFRCVKEIKK